jgi:hypothetical protein
MATPPLSDHLAIEAAEAYKRFGYDGAQVVGMGGAAFGSRVRTAIERGMCKRSDRRSLDGQPMPSKEELQQIAEDFFNGSVEARKGHAPGHWQAGVAPGYLMGKVTVQRNAGGTVERTWERQSPDDRLREQVIRQAIEVLCEGIKGLAPVIPAPEVSSDDIICTVPIGDPHWGMYSWQAETGDDFDTDIARKLTFGAVDRLIASAPPAHAAILLPLGDVFHANDQSNQTPAHKHQLDVDTRFVRVLGIVIETYRHCILRMLEKFSRVVVKFLPGNHDPQAVWALAYAIGAHFCNEPRVVVDLGPSKFWYFRFGKVLIGATHGDTVKPDKLPGIMAADRAEDWGATTRRYWYTGHIHSKNAIEFPGVQWESFRTLAPADAYTASHGYRSGRDMVLIVHHREFGEVERHRFDVGML